MARKSKFTEEQIAYALKQVEAGVPIKELCRKYGISEQTFYVWRKKYGGLSPSELQRLKQLEVENKKLKQLVADLSLDKHMLSRSAESVLCTGTRAPVCASATLRRPSRRLARRRRERPSSVMNAEQTLEHSFLS